MELRDYQTQLYMDARRAYSEGVRRLLIQAATGAGKTVIAARLIQGAHESKSPTVFFAHRRELIYQASDKLEQFGIPHGYIMAGEFEDSWQGVHVSSVDTFRARFMRKERDWPDGKLVFIDEAHRSLSPTYTKIMDEYVERGAMIIGLTATPRRADGKGLGNYYDRMLQAPPIKELIRRRFLVQPRHFAPSVPDLTGVKVKRGDYDEAQLQQVMDQQNLVGDVVTNWLEIARDRQTIVFASGVQHSIHLRDQFLKAGIKAAHIDGNTKDAERAKTLEDLKTGRIQVICNCMVLTEGYDEPSLSCCVLARPTKSIGLYLQMGGRVLRPFRGKKDALIIDHSGAVYQHGKLDDHIPWTLHVNKRKDSDEKAERALREKTQITCERCSTIYQGQLTCPSCGHEPERKGRFVASKDGNLVEIGDVMNPPDPREWRRYEKVKWFNQFLQYAKENDFKRGWAHNSFKKKFKEWPERDFPEVEVDYYEPEFLSYIRYLNISYAYGKQKAAQQAAEQHGEHGRRDIHG